MVAPDPGTIDAEFAASWVLSLILVPFSYAEQKSRLGDDAFPQKNAT